VATKLAAKVAAQVSSTEVALNVGSDRGVTVGCHVQVMREVEVRDPDSQELLGSVVVPKANLVVTTVDARLCIAKMTDSIVVSGRSRLKTLTTNPITTSGQVRITAGDRAEVDITPAPHPEVR